jgi:hypothetical protein
MKKKLSVLGIDIAKQVFHLVGMDAHGPIVVRKRLYRAQVMEFIAQLPPTFIGMEACGGAHYWARRFREPGHEGKLMAPQFVAPYRTANKNDLRDAEGRSDDTPHDALCGCQVGGTARAASVAPGAGAADEGAEGAAQ